LSDRRWAGSAQNPRARAARAQGRLDANRVFSRDSGFAGAPAVAAATRAPQAGALRASAQSLAESRALREGRTSSSSNVSTIRRNINCSNRNGLFSRHSQQFLRVVSIGRGQGTASGMPCPSQIRGRLLPRHSSVACTTVTNAARHKTKSHLISAIRSPGNGAPATFRIVVSLTCSASVAGRVEPHHSPDGPVST
jgi:hypothetical protein